MSVALQLVILVGMRTCCPGEAWPEAEERIRAELTALGLRVETIQGKASGAADAAAALERAARERGAVCAIRASRDAGGAGEVDLWTLDRAPGSGGYRRVRVDGREGGETAAIASFRTIEVLRAGLLAPLPAQAGNQGATPASGTREPAKEQKPAPEPAKRGWPLVRLDLGGSGLGSPGGTGARAAVGLSLGWRPLSFLSAEIDGLASFAGADIEGTEGRSPFYLAAARAFVLYEILDHGSFHPGVGAGGGAVFAWSEGSATWGYRGVKDDVVAGYAGVAAELGIALFGPVWLRVGGRVGLLLPEVRIMFAGKEVARFGTPMIEGFLDLEAAFL
jgi:hypothetical protein